MKFTVRDGFFLQYILQQDDGNGGVMQVPAFFPGGRTVDLPEAVAAANLHMLEPADKAATAFCEQRFVPTAPTAGGVDTAAIAAAVAAALQAAGIQAPAAPPPAPAA